MNKEEIGNLVGDFTWMFGQIFFIETNDGNFLWRCPDYNGDNTLVRYSGSYKDYAGRSYGRVKGLHKIMDYIGQDWEGLSIVEPS